MEVPIVFKIIVLGQQGQFNAKVGVGKSSMLIRYMKGEFSSHYNVTVGVQFASKAVVVDGNKEVKLQIWDTVTMYFYLGWAGSLQGYCEVVL